MKIWHHILVLFATCIAGFAIYCATSYVAYKMRMSEIASELGYDDWTFNTLPSSITPQNPVPGDERLLVVASSEHGFAIASIVRNRRFNDHRALWKLDYGLRPTASGGQEILAVWEPHDEFPTEHELSRFRDIMSQAEVWNHSTREIPEFVE